ncbi:Pr6Pr family membrane protein [Rhodonellum sp.]|uniref:Pr6Pr family membrane protein n=1 Tax=Rhodonellum sp. TaxID=2231180 RepID=UPI0027259222|nr:Pr6Pr family membrane protein [Rhodonellum sp.]MDO9553548.1 Pr6Pr family membrane protein [Rhodonellum sp.]
MKKTLSLIFAGIVWFAVIMQFYLMMENRIASVPETIIRFFSFFTILTNTLVAIYFTLQALGSGKKIWINKTGDLTAITIYILVVGLVYQLILRQIWEPTGMQKIVDELLHSINPILVLVYWVMYENKKSLSWPLTPKWLIYPLVYLVFILIRGGISGFYPYPFVNVMELGLQQVSINAFFLMLLFLGLSAVFVALGKIIGKTTPQIKSWAKDRQNPI